MPDIFLIDAQGRITGRTQGWSAERDEPLLRMRLARWRMMMGGRVAMMNLPLALASLGLLCSIAGILIVKVNSGKSPEKALRMGTMGSSILFIVLAYLLISM